MFKKHMTPLTKGGQTIKHQGKGAQSTDMPNRSQLAGFAKQGGGSINDYGKATPMAQPSPGPEPSGLGSGSWPGNGM